MGDGDGCRWGKPLEHTARAPSPALVQQLNVVVVTWACSRYGLGQKVAANFHHSPSTATYWLALARKWRLSRNKANHSTKWSPQNLQPRQTQSGATALGALKTSSETFSRVFDAGQQSPTNRCREADISGQINLWDL